MRSPDVALKRCDVARKGYYVENRGQVSMDTRTLTNFQIVLVQVSIDITFTRSPDRRYCLCAKVNTVSTKFHDYRDTPAHVLEIA